MPILPVKFRKASEAAIASYNYTDIAEGTGVVTFYGMTTKQDTTKTYILTSSATNFSNDASTGSAAVTTTNAIRLDLDFDLSTFNLPKRIRGTAIVEASLSATKNATSMAYYYIAKIKKNDVVIGQAQSETNSVASDTKYETMTVKIPITTIQNFKKSDILRLTMEVWAGTASGSGSVSLFHDPKNRTVATSLTTQLKVDVPFVLDL
ncbi:hypothetical protein LCGC14_1956470 [marine sediment metagenome]|uniref:Uncharacterized protein n=1 Tax=marine sediment metagenome TaxID=412755 RepID=A0A0F9FG67_9ZZZZ